MTARKRIVVEKDGPYRVEGHIPLVRKRQIVSEHGEPLTWYRSERIPTEDTYLLCRCGQSQDKPFCDGSHSRLGFDGTETAETIATVERQVVFSGVGLVVRRDDYLCMEAGFCGTRFANIERMMDSSSESEIRSLIMAMVERCPSGSFTYSIGHDHPEIEPDLPEQIAVTSEMTSDGPIVGPYWVTGCIPIERSDGEPLELRNRVTICGCGLSRKKPLCDGAHRREHFTG